MTNMNVESYAAITESISVARGSVEVLDEAISELEKVIEELERRTAPVRTQYATDVKVSTSPQAEPANALRGRVARLVAATNYLHGIMSEIDL